MVNIPLPEKSDKSLKRIFHRIDPRDSEKEYFTAKSAKNAKIQIKKC
jgi:hypothetical protein